MNHHGREERFCLPKKKGNGVNASLVGGEGKERMKDYRLGREAPSQKPRFRRGEAKGIVLYESIGPGKKGENAKWRLFIIGARSDGEGVRP